jgi:hypothetical protein
VSRIGLKSVSGLQVLENWLDRAGLAEFFFHTGKQAITVAMPAYRYRPRSRRELNDIHVTKR